MVETHACGQARLDIAARGVEVLRGHLDVAELALKLRVAGRTSGKGQKRQRATLVHALARGGKGACAHEDENGGHDREEDTEAQHNAAARGEERTSRVKPRGWLGW